MFCRLSGDYNPIHTDEDYCYYTPFGGTIYHGIHLLCIGLEEFFSRRGSTDPRSDSQRGSSDRVEFSELSCNFLHYVLTEEKVKTEIYPKKSQSSSPSSVYTIEVQNKNGKVCLRCNFKLKNSLEKIVDFTTDSLPTELKTPTFEEICGDTVLPIRNLHGEFSVNFPNLFSCLNSVQLSQIVMTSYFVGMISPGLHSLYNSLELRADSCLDSPDMLFQVCDKNPDTMSIKYKFIGQGISGLIDTFYRPLSSVENTGLKSDETILYPICPDLFTGRKVLIVGGSRGIGKAIGDILRKGGADEVVCTYCKSGIGDMKLDITKNIQVDLSKFTDLFYMATPCIRTGGGFDHDLYKNYYLYYVDGFRKIFNLMPNLKFVFYPSSQAVLDGTLPEYSRAKLEGEVVIGELSIAHPQITFFTPRLPRILTDQTNSIVRLGKNPYTCIYELLPDLIPKCPKSVYLLSNSTIDFVAKEIYRVDPVVQLKTNPYGQLYQTMITPPLDMIASETLVILNTLEDVLTTEWIFSSAKEDEKQIELYFSKLSQLLTRYKFSSVYILKAFQRISTPFDYTEFSVQFLIDKYNTEIEKMSGVKTIDFSSFTGEKFDLELYLEGRYSFSHDFSQYISQVIIDGICSVRDSVKCIILDLDNTLWDGIIGEGLIDITARHVFLQKILSSYRDRGILLCVCSKNDEEKALEGLNKTGNVLTKDYFTVIKANWSPKSENIREICKILNIREQNILFVDDSMVEREEVTQNTKCQILSFIGSDPVDCGKKLLQYTNLFTTKITITDMNRNELYKNILAQNCLDNREEFLTSLQTKITFRKIPSDYDRAIQLFTKTNQFNLNKGLKIPIENCQLVLLEYTDKYTKHDEVGVIAYKNIQGNIHIENIVLSCRVFNRISTSVC